MIVTLTHRIEVPSMQKATAMREKCAALLDEDDDVTVINSMASKESKTFTVVGVDSKSKEPFEETVEAEDEEDARAQVATETKLVALVTESV